MILAKVKAGECLNLTLHLDSSKTDIWTCQKNLDRSRHRCTRVANPGEGVSDCFLQGVSRLLRKIALFWVLLHFYLQVFWNLPEGGIIFTLPLTPPHPPPPTCVHLSFLTSQQHLKISISDQSGSRLLVLTFWTRTSQCQNRSPVKIPFLTNFYFGATGEWSKFFLIWRG